MPTLWFILVAFMLTMYVLLDGFDLGAGAIHLAAAKTDAERRTIIRAIGPVWDGNEVWLIAAGGTLFFTFPLLYASSFSGFYLPLFIVLWLLMVRGVSIELRSHFANPVWRSFWDGLFFLGSALLTIFYGAALANVVRGVPLDKTGFFFEPLWTDFRPNTASPGILDWYTVLIGLLALSTLTAHGANFIALKTEGTVNARARRISWRAWLATVVLTAGGTIATFGASRATEERVRRMSISALDAHVTVDLATRAIETCRSTNLGETHGAGYRQESVVERIHVPSEEPLLVQAASFLGACLRRDPPEVGLDAAVRCLEVVDAVRLAARRIPATLAAAS